MDNKTKNHKPIVVGLGELLWDMLPQGKKLGGATTNFAMQALALGANAKIVSAVGDDALGNELLKLLSDTSADTQYIHLSDHKTSLVDIVLNHHGHPGYVIHKEVAWDYLPFTKEIASLAQSCDAVCFNTLAQRNVTTRETVHHFLANTKKEDALRVCDINLRQDYYSIEIIENSLTLANVFKLNDDELMVLQSLLRLPVSTEAALKELLTRYQLNLIALTQGAQGSVMITNDHLHHTDSISVAVKDTVGAGDAFTATMVMGLLSGLPIDILNLLATKVAAFVCTQNGATPALPAELLSEMTELTR